MKTSVATCFFNIYNNTAHKRIYLVSQSDHGPSWKACKSIKKRKQGGSIMSELLIDSRLIGQSIKHLRLSRHWTQDYLADRVGYSVRNLRRIENDGTGSIDVVNTFAELFGVSALDILNGCLFVFWTKKEWTFFHLFASAIFIIQRLP